MSATRWAAALAVCLAATAVTACGTQSSNTMPVVAGGFGTDPVISLPASGPPGELVVRTLSQGSGPVVRAARNPGHGRHQADRAASYFIVKVS